MDFVIVSLGLEVVDGLLPVSSENITITAMQALVNLLVVSLLLI